MWQLWLILCGFFLVLEMITAGFFVFWFGIGSIFAMITSFFTDNLIIQTAVFVITSTILLFFTKPFVEHYLRKGKLVATNAFSIIGKVGIVTEDINTNEGTGQIKIEGDIWSAKSDGDKIIPAGTDVMIYKIDGVKAFVTDQLEEKKEEMSQISK